MNKRKSDSHSVAPWRNPEEFRKVYEKLYSKDIADKRWAVDEVLIWETRCRPNLPTAIEVTVFLVRCVIKDALQRVVDNLIQAEDVRLMYSTAIMRFVNLVVDLRPNTENLSMSMQAEKCNIPGWIVDLRHQVAHSILPSLDMLRLGANKALEYLEVIFWKPESVAIQSLVRTTDKEETEIKALVTQLKDILMEEFEDAELKNKNLKSRRSLRNEHAEIFNSLITFLSDNKTKDKVLVALTEPGMFICEKDAIKILSTTAPLFLETQSPELLPQALEDHWMPVLKILYTYDALPSFLVKVLAVERSSWLEQKLAGAWVLRFLHSIFDSGDVEDVRSLDHLLRQGILLDKHCLLYACLKNVNTYVLDVFNILMSQMDEESKQKYHQLYSLVAIKLGWFSKPNCGKKKKGDPPVVFTAQDAEDDAIELKNQTLNKMKKNVFSYVPLSLDLSKVPFGAVLNAEVEEKKPVEVDLSEEEEEPPRKFIIVNEADAELVAHYKRMPSPEFEPQDEVSDEEFKDMIYRPTHQVDMEYEDEEAVE